MLVAYLELLERGVIESPVVYAGAGSPTLA